MSSTRHHAGELRRRQRAAVAALAALARATPDEAASALRLWQHRTGKADADLLLMLDQLESGITAVPEGTSVAFPSANAPREPSAKLELYTQVFAFFDAVWESARRDEGLRHRVALWSAKPEG